MKLCGLGALAFKLFKMIANWRSFMSLFASSSYFFYWSSPFQNSTTLSEFSNSSFDSSDPVFYESHSISPATISLKLSRTHSQNPPPIPLSQSPLTQLLLNLLLQPSSLSAFSVSPLQVPPMIIPQIPLLTRQSPLNSGYPSTGSPSSFSSSQSFS